MRTIELVAGTHRTTRRAVTLVVRAFERRGTRHWTGRNVTGEIADYITEHFGEMVSTNEVGYAIRWLVEHEYGTRTLNPTRTYTKSFAFAEDVLLNRPPEATRMSMNGAGDWNDYRRTGPSPKAAIPTTQPPLPLDQRSPYRLDELMAALRSWARHDRESYATWVDQVLEQMTAAS
jgi:hypothetical protein